MSEAKKNVKLWCFIQAFCFAPDFKASLNIFTSTQYPISIWTSTVEAEDRWPQPA